MTIDFFTQPSRRNAKPDAGELAFVYPPQTAFNPAQVAISANAPHPETARRFVEFVLSRPAQEMLLSRDVRRLPVRKDLYSVHPEIKVNPFSKANLAFDDASRRDRQGLVAALFEIALVSPHKETVELFELLERAEKEKRGNAAQRSEIRRLLTAAPISEEQQKDPVLRRMFDFPDLNPGEPEPIASPKRLATEALWKEEVNQRLLKARTLLQALLSS
jgi:spermidine/putrescine-binding protein